MAINSHHMLSVLTKLKMEYLAEDFIREKVTTDIVGLLSSHDLQCLGVRCRNDIYGAVTKRMCKLRMSVTNQAVQWDRSTDL